MDALKYTPNKDLHIATVEEKIKIYTLRYGRRLELLRNILTKGLHQATKRFKKRSPIDLPSMD